jgi:hypothetical protein
MHDSYQLEKRGVPSVTLSHANFEAAARAHARVLGLPDLPLAVMPRPLPNWDETAVESTIAALHVAAERGLLDGQPK